MVRWKHLHLSVGLLSVWCECTQRHTHPVSVSACLILTCSQTWLVRSRSMQFSDLLCVKLKLNLVLVKFLYLPQDSTVLIPTVDWIDENSLITYFEKRKRNIT